MPNFICKSLNLRSLPFSYNESEFIAIANELRDGKKTDISLVLARVCNNEFLLIIKKRANDSYLIKGDKILKPTNISILQRGLSDFKAAFCDEIISNAINQKSVPQNLAFNINENELAIIAEYFSARNSNANGFLEQNFNATKISNFKNSNNFSVYENFENLCLEIGFGSGAHLLFRAQNEPDTLFVGIEIHRPSLAKVSNLASQMGLKNLLLLNVDARNALSLLPSNTIDKIFVHFPVPWNKSPSRRVLNKQVAKICDRVLKNGGVLELRSDDREFFDASLACFLDLENAKIKIYKNRSLEIISKYEKRWLSEHKDIYDMLYFCTKTSQDLKSQDKDFEFKEFCARKFLENFKNKTFKFDDFFVHLEGVFLLLGENNFILKASFGGFSAPVTSYIIAQNNQAHYLKTPLKTEHNLKAHEIMQQILTCEIL